jgi:hypothetical protein
LQTAIINIIMMIVIRIFFHRFFLISWDTGYAMLLALPSLERKLNYLIRESL